MRASPIKVAHTYQQRVKVSSLRYKKFIEYFKSRIFNILLQNKRDLIEKIREVLDSSSKQELKDRITELAQSLSSLLKRKFKAFRMVFLTKRGGNPGKLFLDQAAYGERSDEIQLFLNASFHPAYWEESPEALFEKVLRGLGLLLDHELIHRAQTTADKRKMGFLDILAQYWSPASYYGSYEELKAYGNTVAQQLAQRGVFQMGEELEDLEPLRFKSSVLDEILKGLVWAFPWTKKKILRKLSGYANKWLEYYKENPEYLEIPTEVKSFYGRVPRKRDRDS